MSSIDHILLEETLICNIEKFSILPNSNIIISGHLSLFMSYTVDCVPKPLVPLGKMLKNGIRVLQWWSSQTNCQHPFRSPTNKIRMKWSMSSPKSYSLQPWKYRIVRLIHTLLVTNTQSGTYVYPPTYQHVHDCIHILVHTCSHLYIDVHCGILKLIIVPIVCHIPDGLRSAYVWGFWCCCFCCIIFLPKICLYMHSSCYGGKKILLRLVIMKHVFRKLTIPCLVNIYGEIHVHVCIHRCRYFLSTFVFYLQGVDFTCTSNLPLEKRVTERI